MIAALAVFATACSSAAVPVSSSPVPVTTAATTAAPTTVASSAPSVPSASDLLDGVVAALARTDTDSVLAVLAPDATFSLDGLDITLDRQLSADLAWLGAILELSPDATGLELLRAWLDLGWLMKARYVVGDCRTVGSAASCTFSRSDVETRITGQHVTGTLTIQSLGNLITRLEQFATTEGDVDPVFDTFMRWALIDQPDLGRELSAIRRAELLVGATDRWGAAGRPDVAAPDGIDGPVEVVHVYLEARNSGDWATHTALLSGEALMQPFGSRDEFEAALLLERRVEPDDCEIVLEGETVGTVVACQVTVTDIITATAGVAASNPNATTFGVRDGRLVRLPSFIPSLFHQETAIEEWAASHLPEEYASACPDGIAGQDIAEGLPCAQFISHNRELWAPSVEALSAG